MKYNAVIFDFDFTLADATPGIVSCVNYALDRLGFDVHGTDAIRKTVGMTLQDTFQALTGNREDAFSAQFVSFFKEKADLVMTDSTTLFPDTVDILARLKKDGQKVGIVTSKFHYRIDQVLEKYGIKHLVDHIVGFEDVKAAKPSPEGLLQSMESLGVDREKVLYVGDSLIDAKTAANASAAFAAVTTGTTAAPDFEALPHTAIVSSLTALYDTVFCGEIDY